MKDNETKNTSALRINSLETFYLCLNYDGIPHLKALCFSAFYLYSLSNCVLWLLFTNWIFFTPIHLSCIATYLLFFYYEPQSSSTVKLKCLTVAKKIYSMSGKMKVSEMFIQSWKPGLKSVLFWIFILDLKQDIPISKCPKRTKKYIGSINASCGNNLSAILESI